MAVAAGGMKAATGPGNLRMGSSAGQTRHQTGATNPGSQIFAVIVETRIRNNGNCRLRKVPWQERVRPGAGQLFAMPDKTTQPEEPGGIHEYRPGKYSDSCSRYGLNPSPLLNHPSCRCCCVREPDQIPPRWGLKCALILQVRKACRQKREARARLPEGTQ